MEWKMVWKDITFGFTIAGIIAVFIPPAFFQTLFIGGDNPNFLALLEQTIIGPVAAFLTFIGSMGNIPLASVLFANGVSFAGVMAFIFSDLVVFPVIRINAKYYGWKLALYIVGVFLAALVATAILMHYGFAILGLLPESTQVTTVAETQRFAIDYTFWLNLFFVGVTGIFAWLQFGGGRRKSRQQRQGGNGSDQSIADRLLFYLAIASYIWLAGGVIVSLFV